MSDRKFDSREQKWKAQQPEELCDQDLMKKIPKLTKYFKAAEFSSSPLTLQPQQEDCQQKANIGAVESNTMASGCLAVATGSSEHGKDISQRDCNHATQPSHSDK